MSKTVLASVQGWTPCIDSLTRKYGVMTSAIFGRVWRYCQGNKGVCEASIDTIANDLGLSYRTVLTHIKHLVREGYLADLTPKVRNAPHIYADTGKAGLCITVEAVDDGPAATDQQPVPVSTPAPAGPAEAQPQSPTPQSKEKKRVQKDTKPRGTRDPLIDHPAVRAYRGILHTTPNAVQRQAIAEAVTDITAWEEDLRHWAGHGYNVRNALAILDFHGRGGARTCTKCNGTAPKRSGSSSRFSQNGGAAAVENVIDEFLRQNPKFTREQAEAILASAHNQA